VRSQRGYAILRVLERKAFDPAIFEAQKAATEASLLEQKREKLFQAFMNEARERYALERNPAALRRVLGQG
jgi:parvulin-like peptidyl-prolyl isomerase